jgi:hypothetical protein
LLVRVGGLCNTSSDFNRCPNRCDPEDEFENEYRSAAYNQLPTRINGAQYRGAE